MTIKEIQDLQIRNLRLIDLSVGIPVKYQKKKIIQ